MECDHRTALDLADKAGLLATEPGEAAGMLVLAGEHGQHHEARVLKALKAKHSRIVEIPQPANNRAAYRAAAAETAFALDDGAEVVYQACFFDESFVGFADFVIRVGDGYEVFDTKLARHAKPGALLQLAAYSEQLQRLGHPLPDKMHVWLGNDEIASFAVADVLPKLRQVRSHLLDQIDAGPVVPTRIWGDSRPACASCKWVEVCDRGRDDDRDLSLVAGIRGDQRRRFHDAGITTLEQLGTAGDDDCPSGMGIESFQRLRAQAALQAQQDATRGTAHPEGTVSFEFFSDVGLRPLPPPSPGDVWFDMEGDPFAERGDGLEYLFGYITVDDTSEDEPRFTPIWAHSPAEERAAFETFVDRMQARLSRWPDMHIYHYANYERAALSRLAGRHGTREEEIDNWLREGRLVDLMKVFKGSFRVSQRSYSIKKLEALYGLERAEDITTAGDSVVDYEAYLDLSGVGRTEEARHKLEAICEYNQVDCESTLRLDRWIRSHGEQPRTVAPPDPAPDGPGKDASSGDSEDSPYERLMVGVPETGRTPQQQAQAMMHAAVGYFGREARPQWWDHYKRLDAPAEDWETDREVLIVGSGRAGSWEPKESRTHRASVLTIREGEGPEYSRGEAVYLVYDQATGSMQTGTNAGRGWTTARVESHEGTALRISGEAIPIAGPEHSAIPVAVFPEARVRDGCLVSATRQFADHWLEALPGMPASAVTDLLLRRRPRLSGGGVLPRTGDHGADVQAAVRLLDGSYLAVQGPPGSGKTYLAAELIVALVGSGWRIGVVAQSHKAIEHVLDTAIGLGLDADRVAKKPKSGTPADKPYHRSSPRNWLARQGGGALIGGTAWTYCSAGMADQLPLDLLVIEEAGQYSLGYTIALRQAARNILLLGDPQQLPQVSKGAHPEPVDTAALSWLAGESPILPVEFGYFLDRTRRMNPEVCEVVSQLSYAGELVSHPVTEDRWTQDVAPGVHAVPVDHQDRSVHAPEEVRKVVGLVRDHLGIGWVEDGAERPLGQGDVLVVAPFNAQVDAIRKALRRARLDLVRVGTVDKFQGQEAPVVIVSMTASSREEVPRGMGFVLSRNRLNVAISRAEWASFVVHSPALGDHSPASVSELVLLGAFLGVVDRVSPARGGPTTPAPSSPRRP